MSDAVEKRQVKEKQLLLEELKKNPIIQIACVKSGVGRASFYRWKEQDPEFAKTAEKALSEGKLLINDAAESQLLALIKQGNLGAIVFWLRNNHPGYSNKVEVMAKIQTEEKPLTTEQEQLITKALQLVSGSPTLIKEEEKK